MLTDTVKGFPAQIQMRQGDVSAIHSVVVASALHEGRERIFAGVSAWSVPTIVTECDGFDERSIEPDRLCDGRRDLGHFNGMCQTIAEMGVVWRQEHLTLSSQATERSGVLDAVHVALEARAVFVRLLFDGATTCPCSPCRQGRQDPLLGLFAQLTSWRLPWAICSCSGAVEVSDSDAVRFAPVGSESSSYSCTGSDEAGVR